MIDTVFDHVARLAILITGGHASVVSVCDGAGIDVVGSDGIDLGSLDISYSLGFLSDRAAHAVFVRNVRRDPRFKSHPILDVLPAFKGLAFLPVACGASGTTASIVVFEPDPKALAMPATAVSLNELGALTRSLLDGPSRAEPQPVKPLAEASAPFDSGPEPVMRFLLDTLQSRVKLHTRKGCSYTSVRTWREPLKKYQISALAALKLAPPGSFVAAAAKDIVRGAIAVVGGRYFDCVVSVPCGHSATEHCFSSMLGSAVAGEMSVPHVAAFRRQSRKGKSHPRRNGALQGFELEQVPPGKVLLVDDVATSGRHLAEAVAALRGKAESVMCMAWIGAS